MFSEAEALRRAVRDFLSAVCGEAVVRQFIEAGGPLPPVVWARLTRELGLTSISVPERFGGHGAGRPEQVVVHEEMGRAMFPGPYFATTALATSLVLATADETACAAYLPSIADGTSAWTVAIQEGRSPWEPAALRTVAAVVDGSWQVSGKKSHVVDAEAADSLLVVAATPDGPGVFVVDRRDPRVEVAPRPTLDPTRRQSVVTLLGAAGRLVGTPGKPTEDAVASMLDEAAIALAAEQAGGARRMLELTVEHLKTREQFGRQIGSFQSLKHLAAEMLLDVESAAALAHDAAAAPPEDLRVLAHAAKSLGSEAFWRVASSAVQAHGGIGFTWEHPAQLYFKRAKSSELMFGSPAEHREALLASLGR